MDTRDIFLLFLLVLSEVFCKNVAQPGFEQNNANGKNQKKLNEFTFDSANLPHDRNLIVHLFEWKWKDIAYECRNYLGANGYGAVQISPPVSHIFDIVKVEGHDDFPWYFRYQPTSFALDSRSGTEKEFIEMVEECNKSGVRILVDVILNHMASVAYAYDGKNASAIPRSFDGKPFSAISGQEDFPNPGYKPIHFNDPKCNGNIDDYENRYNVQYCRLVSLVDVDHSNSEVQEKIATFLNRLIDIGVMGFRVDASKHMVANDLAKIFPRLNNLKPKYFGEGKEPFLTHEVISYPSEPIQMTEYTNLGRVMHFGYGQYVTQAIRGWQGKKASDLLGIHEGRQYGNLMGHQLLVFLDNHDNQRYETDSHITHKNEWEYRIAVAFMFAHTYGVPRLMSSYIFGLNNQGPPNHGQPNFQTTSPTFNDGGCGNGWVCEHRWAEIRRMAKWRSEMGGSAMALIHYQHGNCFGFARLDRGYFAFNNDRSNECVLENVDTSLPPGTYCNIFVEDFNESCNIKNQIIVGEDGKALVKVPKFSVAAFGLSSKINDNSSTVHKEAPSNSNQPTIIFMKKNVPIGRHVFLRGGRANVSEDCNLLANKFNKCAIPIRHLMAFGTNEPSIVYEHFSMWKQGDNFLDFHGGEHAQGTVSGEWAQGTPTIYTTNKEAQPTFSSLNAKFNLGDDHWLVVLDIDCGKDSEFYVKGFSLDEQWEPGSNHKVYCGKVNLLEWGTGNERVLE